MKRGRQLNCVIRRACLITLTTGTVMLQSCGVITAPGFDYADPGQRTSITLGQFVPTDADSPPPGVITPISPTLVQAQYFNRPKDIPMDVRALFAKPDPYTIGPSDVVGIVVYDHPELLPATSAVISQATDPTGISSQPGFIVSASGEVSFPYVGRVKLSGLTEIQASEMIAARLSEYITRPQVTVRIAAFRSRRAYVEGEVRSPGMQIFTDVPMTLPEALNRAGGITSNGDRSFVTLTRNEKTTLINLPLLQDLGVNPNNILLQSGDLVTVRSRDESKVYVMGEILKPSALLMHNGRLTLNEALGEAGGVNLSTANPGQIYVIRKNSQGGPAIFHLDAKSPAAFALADTFALKSRDVVYVDPVPLVLWNRVISLILPSAQVVNIGSELQTR